MTFTRASTSRFLLLSLVLAGLLIVPSPVQVRATGFSIAQQVPTSATSFTTWPSAGQDGLGRVWLAYSNKTEGSPKNPGIWFKVWNGSAWAAPKQVTSDPNQNITPVLAPLSNGSMMILWSSNRTAGNRYQLFYKLYSGLTTKPSPTSSDIRLTTSLLNDSQPSAFQDRNGRIWVLWSRQNQTSPAGSNGVFTSDIYYKYFNGSSWSADFPLPQASNITVNGFGQTQSNPSMLQTKDGRIWTVWESNMTSDGSADLFYETTDGTLFTLPFTGIPANSWSARKDLCCSDNNADDGHPSIVQARNGTIMVVWQRCVGTNCIPDIFFMSSSDNGVTWSSPIPIPAASTTTAEFLPTAMQRNSPSDKSVWLFWQKEGLFNSEIWYTSSDQIVNVHDVGISNLVASPRLARSGIQWDNSGLVKFNVTVTNFGDYSENTTLTLSLNGTSLPALSVTRLALGEKRLFQTTWQTVLPNWGRYLLTASLQPVLGESVINQGDNLWSGGTVRVSPPGDVDYNGCVNIYDAAQLAFAYDTTPGMPLWNPGADVDHTGKIDIFDAAFLAFYFDKCV